MRPGARPSRHPPRVRRRPAADARRQRARCTIRHAARDARATRAPVAYQVVAGTRVPVDEPLSADGTARSALRRSPSATLPRDRDLIIDPGIQYTTFLGGGGDEIGAGIAVDAAGNAYVAGTTQSPDFPTTAGAFRRTGAAQQLRRRLRHQAERRPARRSSTRPSSAAATWSSAARIAIDAAGNAYITGQTKSSQLPGHRRRLRPHPQHPAELPALRDRRHRRLRHQAERDRLGARLFDVPRRHRLRQPARHRGRCRRQRLRRRRDAVAGLSDDAPARSAATYSGNYDMFVTKLNADGLGARLLDVPRRHAGRQRRARRRRRRRQRLRARLHQLDSTSRRRRAHSTRPATAASTSRSPS